MVKKDKYQWANHIRSLSHDEIRDLIKALEGSIALNVGMECIIPIVPVKKLKSGSETQLARRRRR